MTVLKSAYSLLYTVSHARSAPHIWVQEKRVEVYVGILYTN